MTRTVTVTNLATSTETVATLSMSYFTLTWTMISVSTKTVVGLPFGLNCVIATATYGSELAPEVQFLRTFRDQFVQSTFAGAGFFKAFNSFYYSFSPAVASVVAGNPALSQMIRLLLYPLMGVLHVSSVISQMLSFSPELSVVISGLLAAALIGAVYLTPFLAVMKMRTGRRERSS